MYCIIKYFFSSQVKTHTRSGSTRPYHSSESEKQNIKENMKKRDRGQCDRALQMTKWTNTQYKNTIYFKRCSQQLFRTCKKIIYLVLFSSHSHY